MSAAMPDNPHVRQAEKARTPAYTYAAGTQPLAGYTIKRGLGQGGFGEVYYALSDAGKEVALKVVRRNLDVELRGVTQCLNLKHQNLVGLYDVRTDAEGNYWIVMEYVAGERLVELIERHPQGLPPAEAVRLVRGIAAAVAYLHDNGIVHRDLKPANIFVENGIVKIGDYGLTKFISVSRRSGQTESVGTVHYMAPEIANGRYGKQIDVYALGVLLYELLTGRVPFDGESVGEILMKHLTAEADLSPAPEPYRSVIAAALEKDPERRTKTVDDFLRLLDQAAPATADPANVNPVAAGRPPREREPFCAGRQPLSGSRQGKSPAGALADNQTIAIIVACVVFPPALLFLLPYFYYLGRPKSAGLGFPWHALLLVIPVVGMVPLWFLFRASASPLEHSNLVWGNVVLSAAVLSFFVLPIVGFVILQRQRSEPASGGGQLHGATFAGAVRSTPHRPSYAWAVVPAVVLLLFVLYGLKAGLAGGGGVAAWPILVVPAIVALGFSLWTADWVRRRRAAIAARETPGGTPTSSQARPGVGPTGWLLIAAVLAGVVLLTAGTSFRMQRSQDAAMRAFNETQEIIRRSQAGGVAAPHRSVQPSIRKSDGTTVNMPPGWMPGDSGPASPQGDGAAPPAVFSSGPVHTPSEAFLMFGFRTFGVLLILGVLGLAFWLARRSREHYDPTQAAFARGDLASTQVSVELPPARGPPLSLRTLGVDITGGLLVTFVCTAIGIRLVLIMREAPLTLAQYLWTSASTFTAAALWIVLLKTLRPLAMEALGRRGISMLVGVATGAAAWFYADYLGLTLPIETSVEGVGLDRWPECYAAGRPTVPAFLGYFGLAFGLVDWWGLTSPTRPRRWSLSDVFVAVFWGFLVHLVFPFPQWWGVLVVAGCAAVLPVAFPNLDKAARVRMRVRK